MPADRFPIEAMYHGSRLAPKGFTHVHHFFLPRAAQALAAAWRRARDEADPDLRRALLTFCAGVALGYFLERWGTTRECWIYWTRETPPFFAVLAHGMAAVAFGRTQNTLGLVLKPILRRIIHSATLMRPFLSAKTNKTP
ncbi:MAG: hypothetical protein WCJ30_18450 [Deltaproteobacteria bacterium]